jgi:hypothetical protein
MRTVMQVTNTIVIVQEEHGPLPRGAASNNKRPPTWAALT